MEVRHVSRELNKKCAELEKRIDIFLSQFHPVIMTDDLENKRNECHDLRIQAETLRKMLDTQSAKKKWDKKIERLRSQEKKLSDMSKGF